MMKNNKSMINEDRLFSLLPFFFDKPDNVYVELAQNAQRAGARNLHITLNESKLTVLDDGNGTDNAEALVTLADSNWTADVEKSQCPAGWGLFFLVCISERVTFKSRFGSLSFDCNVYLNDAGYRGSVLDMICRADQTAGGFYAEAYLKEGIAGKMARAEQKLCYFPLDITFNGNPVQKESLGEKYAAYPLKTQYQGNVVLIDPKTFRKWPNLTVIWYGIYIGEDRWTSNHMAIDVTCGTPLTPVLPYRHAVKEDDKLDDFREFCRAKVVEYCTAMINNSPEGMRNDEIIKLMETMSAVATREELDNLNRFFVSTREPYYNSEAYADSQARDVLVNKDSAPLNNEIAFVYLCSGETKTEVEDIDDALTLPAGTITSIECNSNSPLWMKEKVLDKEIIIEVHRNPGDGVSYNYSWQRAVIKSEKEIKVLALVNGGCEGTIYYADTPEQFYEIQDAVFAQKIFYEDGDSWDSQEYYFNKDINSDISKILGKFSVYDLLKGLSIAEIAPADVMEIKINKGSMLVELKGGGKKTLKIAA